MASRRNDIIDPKKKVKVVADIKEEVVVEVLPEIEEVVVDAHTPTEDPLKKGAKGYK